MGSGCCGGSKAVVQPTPVHDTHRHKTPVPVPHKYEPARIKSSPPRRESSAMQRFNKIAITNSNPLKLIDGYQNEPLLPLEEALKPFDGKIDHLSHHIKEAKTKCHYPSEHHLTHDESAAIYIYTMHWGHGCLYDQLHAAWSSGDRSRLIPWFKYLRLFKSALDKLPNAKTEIWQGAASSEDLKHKLTSKSPLYCSMGSCAPSDSDIKGYLHNNYGDHSILIGYKGVDGKLVAGYTAGSSKEVILFPGMKLAVADYIEGGTGSVVVHLHGQPSKSH